MKDRDTTRVATARSIPTNLGLVDLLKSST